MAERDRMRRRCRMVLCLQDQGQGPWSGADERPPEQQGQDHECHDCPDHRQRESGATGPHSGPQPAEPAQRERLSDRRPPHPGRHGKPRQDGNAGACPGQSRVAGDPAQRGRTRMLIATDCPTGSVVADGGGQVVCPRCSASFTPRRRDQRYCAKPCAKVATRHASRGPRTMENARRTQAHYDRAAWLCFDVLRMSPPRQRRMLLSILEAASGGDAPLRNILLDPALLGAAWGSAIGKLYPDTKCGSAPNIAKIVNAFCMGAWGCGVRDAILDDGKPAHRVFAEDEGPAE